MLGPYRDADVAGGEIELGSRADGPFIFDNEKFAHVVEIAPFQIARTPVTNAAFRNFVEDGGYSDKRYWSDAGWRWREEVKAVHPIYWRRGDDGNWWVRTFDTEIALPPNHPVSHGVGSRLMLGADGPVVVCRAKPNGKRRRLMAQPGNLKAICRKTPVCLGGFHRWMPGKSRRTASGSCRCWGLSGR